MRDADDLVLLATEGPGIAIVTINRPAKRNALSLAVWPRLGAIFRDLAARPEVRAAILTGAGGHFSAGADIAEFATARSDAGSVGLCGGDVTGRPLEHREASIGVPSVPWFARNSGYRAA